ncbi:epsin domain-containing protein [Amylocystis lapponica]|nr:epsin domain-containing protein [Amylocystis lapponica]
MAFQSFGKGALRTAKNYTKGYSHTQTKVRDVTSNDPLPPSGRQMHEIAQMTYDRDDFIEIVEMLDKRLNDKGKNWRHVYKCLTLLDYLLHSGSENVIVYFRENMYIVKTLGEFQYIDDDGKDQGANVRQKARDISNLLQDDARLRHERRSRAQMYQRMSRDRRISGDYDGLDEDNARRRSLTPVGRLKRAPSTKEQDDLRRALEESKRSTELARATAEERDIQRALKMSQEEEEKRKRAVLDSNAAALFDDSNQQPAIPTGQLIDATLPLQYTASVQPQYTSMQPQFTSVQPQFTSIQPQYTAFNPWQQQAQAQMEAMQQAEWMCQQQELQAQQQQQVWLTQQQMLQAQQQSQLLQVPQQPIPGQPTAFGSNNPFAPGPPSSAPPFTRQFTSPGPQQQTGPAPSGPQGRENAASAPPASFRGPSRTDQQHAQLANIFATRGEDGIDTFGNFGQLRYGFTPAGRTVAQRTGAASRNSFSQQNDPPFFSV